MSFKSILENELKAALLGLKLFNQQNVGANSLVLKVDNKAVVALINNGRCKWQIDPFKLAAYLQEINDFKRSFRLHCSYVRSESNPADFF